MSETKAEFRIDKPGAYKLRGGGVADIVEVNHKSAFGWLRSDTIPMNIRRWDRTGIADAGCWDIVATIPFIVDGPGRYMMRNGLMVTVVAIEPLNKYPVRGEAQWCWTMDGSYSRGESNLGNDLIRKMHPLEQKPVAKAPEATKAPETKDPLDKPAFRITEHGVYCTRNGRVVDVYEVTNTKANGHWQTSGNKREWDVNGRTHSYIELGSDIVMKAPPADGVLTITDVLNRLRADWDRQLTERKEKARKNNRSTKTPETPKTPPKLHDVLQAIDGKPTQKPSEEQLKLAYQEAERGAQLNKKPSTGFDVVVIQNYGALHSITVAGVYSIKDGVATVLPVEVDRKHVDRACSEFPGHYNVMILNKGEHVRCPAHNVTCVIHCVAEE